MQTQSPRRPPVGEPCQADTPAFANQWHAQNHLWLRALGDARQAEESPELPCRLACASSAYVLFDVVARLTDPLEERQRRAEAIERRDVMAELVAATMQALGYTLD